MARISLIIPCYNYAQYVGEAIQSAIDQTYQDKEIIVVDDGSTDNSASIIKKYPVKYIYQENKGLSAARNTGIRNSTGDKIVCLDADDKFDPTYLLKGSRYRGIVVCGIQHFGDKMFGVFPDTRYMRLSDFLIVNRIHCASMFDKKDWEEVGGYDEQMLDGYEDWEFWIRLVVKGIPITAIKELLFWYRLHSGSMHEGSMLKHNEIVLYIRHKHPELYKGIEYVKRLPRKIGGNCEYCGTNICKHYLE